MSLLAASRPFSSAVMTLGKHLRAVAVFHHCSHSPQIKSSHRRISDGSRDYSHPAYSDSENLGEKKTHIRAKRKPANSMKLQKLHNRKFTEEELDDDQTFRNQKFVSENEGDVFGNFQPRREPSKMVSRSEGKNSKISFQTEAFGSTDGAEKRSVHDEFDFSEHSRSKGKRRQPFGQKGRVKRETERWEDQFGTLCEDSIADRIDESLNTAVGSHEERFSDEEEEQGSRHIRLSAVNRRHIPEWYGRRILKLGKRGQVREAIEVFDDWMLKQDRVMPNTYVFTCLLTVLGRAGYTKKAFSLFRKMRSMGIQPAPATYTALFNACANSPWKSDGRTRADSLLHGMKEKEIEPTFITGKAMVKAFAMCGDLRRAFSLVDELSQVYRPDPEMFSFLLMACISDQKEGLRHAIQVWQVMQQMKVKPDRPLYNLLLRCVRDCQVGDTAAFTSLLTGGAAPSQLEAGSTQPAPPLPSHPTAVVCDTLEVKEAELSAELESSSADHGQMSAQSEILSIDGHELQPEDRSHLGNPEVRSKTEDSKDLQNIHSQSELVPHRSVAVPDILSPNCSNSEIISLGDLSTKENRLMLLGGVDGFLSRMSKDGASPDVVTFTQLINVAMPTVATEQQVLDTMKSMQVKLDTDLVNSLIHKRCMRGDFVAAKAAKEILKEYGLTANQKTYGVLAMTCQTKADAVQLLQDMEAADMTPNVEILGTLIVSSGMRFGYKLWVLRQAQHLDLQPNTKFLHNVEKSLAIVRRLMIQEEKQGKTHSYLLSPEFQQTVETFTWHYESWLKQTQVEVPRHPWSNFRLQPKDNKDSAV